MSPNVQFPPHKPSTDNEQSSPQPDLIIVTGRLETTQTGVGFLYPLPGSSASDSIGSVLLKPALARRFFHGDQVRCHANVDPETGRWVAHSATREAVRPAFVARIRKVNEGRFEAIPLDKKIRHLFFSSSADYVPHCLYCIEPVMDQQGNDRTPFVSLIGSDHLQTTFIKASLIEHRWPDRQQYTLQACDHYISKSQSEQYMDLRHLPFISIDGRQTQDRDDAVFVESSDAGFVLWVAITDVCRYVKPHSPLDAAAREKGQTLYLPHFQSPMLPESLSHQVCSLTAGRVQSVIVCRLLYDLQGELLNASFLPAEICVCSNLSYEEVDAFFVQSTFLDRPPEVLKNLKDWEALTTKLLDRQRQREHRFPNPSLPQAEIAPNGEITGFMFQPESVAKKMVEIAMVETNCAAGQILSEHGLGIFRCQGAPTLHLLQEAVSHIAQELSLQIPSCTTVEQLYHCIKPHFDVLSLKHQALLRRCFSRTEYRTAVDDTEHFMLGLTQYATITSPLRRYADLQNQRLIKHIIGLSPLSQDMLLPSAMSDFATQCNVQDRSVSGIEQTYWDLAYHHYLRGMDGHALDFTITKIRPSSIQILLNNTAVVLDLNTYHYRHRPVFDKKTCSISLPDGSVFNVGDQIRCRIDFSASAFYPVQWIGMKEKCSTIATQMV